MKEMQHFLGQMHLSACRHAMGHVQHWSGEKRGHVDEAHRGDVPVCLSGDRPMAKAGALSLALSQPPPRFIISIAKKTTQSD